MKSRPLVSVIVAMYNCERYIRKCIESLCGQKYTNIEIIVVDDGSTDDSQEIVEELRQKYQFIRYIYQNNSGPGRARNNAISKSQGKYLLFVDADDYLGDDYIYDLVNEAEEKYSELVFGGYTLVYSNSKKNIEVVPKFYEQRRAEEWAYRISSTCSRLYLKEFWESHGLKFSEEKQARAEDVPIVLYSNIMAKNISYVQNSGYYYYQHVESAMNSKKKIPFLFPYDAFEEMYHRVKERETVNNIEFWHIGILKFLAHFTFVIYRKANKREKEKFIKAIKKIIGCNFCDMVIDWNKREKEIDLTFLHKLAVKMFILYYRANIKRIDE